MTKVHTFLLALVAVAASSLVNGAEVVKLNCEEWHPRLGQVADRSYAIDVSAKTCNGQPCTISDSQLKWAEENGRIEVSINRAPGDGTRVLMGELVSNYKNCKLVSVQS